MKKVVEFLCELQQNNCSEWFHAHKKEYDEIRAYFNDFALELIAGVGKFDENVRGLALKDCTYRINRDIRFSADKSPYKTHMGVFIAPGGKKSGKAGYYFHLSVGGDGYPDGCMLAVGHYCYDKKVVEIVREDLMDEPEKFENYVQTGAQDGFVLDYDGALKKVPKEFAECEHPDYIRLKTYCLMRPLSLKEVSDRDALLAQLLHLFERNKPFIDYLNQVIEYVEEGN